MFSKLFTPKLQHPDPQKRLSALEALTASDEDMVLLSQLALNDPDTNVREQALNRFETHVSDQTTIEAMTAMNLFNIAEPSMKAKIVVHIKDQKCLEQCIENSIDQQDLMLLASKSVLPQARKKAAEKISGLDNLKQLQIQTNDKNVLQLVRQKINLIKDQQKASDAAEETLGQVCYALERLSKSDFEPMMTSRVNLLESHWLEVDDQYKSEFVDRYNQASKQCHEIIRQAHEQQALAEFEKSQNEICLTICDDYENKISKLALNAVEAWPNVQEEIEQQWVTCNQNFSPKVEISERFHTLKSASEKMLTVIEALKDDTVDTDLEQLSELDIDTLKTHEQKLFDLTRNLNWPYKFKQPDFFLQIKNQQNQIKNRLKDQQSAQKKKLMQIDSKISILKSHIRQKNLIKANRMLNYIQSLIDELPETVRLKEHDKMNSVIISLNELRGLNEFITQPKKLELCEQMEALVNKNIEPEKLMDKIKGIQSKWKSLATSDAQADDILWERFKLAADKAYLPCAAYLAELEEVKNKNLSARIELIKQLEKQLGEQQWEHVDWKHIQVTHTNYWKQWRSLSPVFFSQNKAHQKKFESLIAVLKDKLDAEKNENHQIYDQLIDRVVQLAESLSDDNVDEAIEQVKRIQASWKNVGIAHFNKSRKQWNKFHKCCDQVFEYQRDKLKLKRQHEHKQLDQVHELVNKIRALIKLPDEQFADSQTDFQNLVEEFESIEVPEFHKEKSQRLFNRAGEDYQSHLAGLGKRNKLQAHNIIRQAAVLCCKAETLALSGADQSEFDNLKSEYAALNLEKELAQKETAETLKQRIDAASSVIGGTEKFDPDQCKKNELALSELAIRLEVLFDLPTPEYALKQRMDYQLEQLQLGIKPALSVQDKQKTLLDIELGWYQIGAVSVDARKMLEQRLAIVIKQAEN